MVFRKRIIKVVLIIGLVIYFACDKNNPNQGSAKDSDLTGQAKLVNDIPVEAMVVRAKSVQQNIPVTAILEPMHTVDIVAEVSGKVEAINKKLGDYVTKNDVLGRIDDKIPLSNYRQAKSQVLSAENNLKIAQLNLKSDEKLMQTGDISELEYENSQLAVKMAEANHLSALANLSLMEKTYQDTRISSPFSGLISRKYIDIGMMVTPNMPLYRVVDLSNLKMEVGVPQSLISRVRIGSKAQVAISGLGSEKFDGYVRFVSPQADEQSGSFMVEVHVKNTKDLRIRAGMTAKVEMTLFELGEQLVIPKYALVSKNGSDHVYKIKKNKALLTPVFTGETFGSQIVVQEGLVQGDTIVVVGMKNLGLKTDIWIETLY